MFVRQSDQRVLYGHSLDWYSTCSLRFLMSLPYMLHGDPLRVKSAVAPPWFALKLDTEYPGQLSGLT